ncbi:MAG: F0F1 ATP synthase subunit B' [Rhodobacteraceae bacterium]|nr:F0F1 ATP synthase subunit B' [Paracoccaceae bacterium]
MAIESTASAGTSCIGPDGGAVGMPQLCTDWYANQIFWLVITLVVVYVLMSRIALPRIASVIQERHDAIQNDLEQAEMLRTRAFQAEEDYKKALAEARAEANTIVAETRSEIARDIKIAAARADAEIASKAAESEVAIKAIRDNALEAVRDVSAETAEAVVNKIMPGLDTKGVQAAIDARMKV